MNISLGSSPLASRRLIQKYGIVPTEAWSPKAGFNLSSNTQRINAYVKNIIAKTRHELESLQEEDVEAKKEITTEAQIKIKRIFNEIIGVYPNKFFYKGEEFTPQSFQQKFFPELASPLMTHKTSQDRKALVTLTSNTAHEKVITGNLEHMEQKLKEVLDAGKMVYLGYTHDHNFVDKKTGIMSISAFEIPSGAGPLNRALREKYGLNAGAHAVHVVGYDLDPKTEKIIKWKIKNSWGLDAGEGGYYHMYSDYFRAFVNRFSYYRDE